MTFRSFFKISIVSHLDYTGLYIFSRYLNFVNLEAFNFNRDYENTIVHGSALDGDNMNVVSSNELSSAVLSWSSIAVILNFFLYIFYDM